jgi:IPT/TIG domain
MKRVKFSIFVAVFLASIFAFAAETRAGIWGYSEIEYKSSGNRIETYSYTLVDYPDWYYYDAGIDTYLVDQNYNYLDGGYEFGSYIVEVSNETPATAGMAYGILSDHYVEPLVYCPECYPGAGYYDPYGFSSAKALEGVQQTFDVGELPEASTSSLEIRQSEREGESESTYTSQGAIYVGSIWLTIRAPLGDPHIDSISPNGFPAGTDATFLLRFHGQNLSPRGDTGIVPTVNVSGGSGVTVVARPAYEDPTGLESEITVSADAPVGDRTLTITVGNKTSNAVTFRVGDRSPIITGMSPPEANAGESVTVTINGTGFGLNPQVQIDGLGVNPTIHSQSSTQIVATFSVADSTYAGERTVKVRSQGVSGTGFILVPGNSDTSNGTPFNVFKPTVTLQEINLVPKGGTQTVRLTVQNAKPTTDTYVVLEQLSNGSGNARFTNGATGYLMQGNLDGNLVIEGLAESTEVDKYVLKVRTDGAPLKTDNFTVYSVAFDDAARGQNGEPGCSGFDDTPSLPYLLVPKNGSNTAKVKVLPTALTANIALEGDSQNGISVSPTSVAGGTNTITVNAGNNTGDFSVLAKAPGGSSPAATLKIAARPRINKTVIFHTLAEDNDDVQAIPFSAQNTPQGAPNTIAIKPNIKKTGTMTTALSGDDTRELRAIGLRSYFVITTGPDGIRQTPKALGVDDIELIDIGKGEANTACVTAGANLFRDTDLDALNDDILATDSNGTEYINSGANGLCETRANNTDLAPAVSDPTKVPTVQSLQDYLNNTAWGRQANVYFTVTRGINDQVNYDMNRDGQLSSQNPLALPEINAIVDKAKNSNYNYNIYYVGTPILPLLDANGNPNGDRPGGFTNRSGGDTWIGTIFTGSVERTTGHEAGHLLGIAYESTNTYDLMFGKTTTTNPCQVRKSDWDVVNP